MAKHTVVTYTQANGKPAKTVVNPAQLKTLEQVGRLIARHPSGK